MKNFTPSVYLCELIEICIHHQMKLVSIQGKLYAYSSETDEKGRLRHYYYELNEQTRKKELMEDILGY